MRFANWAALGVAAGMSSCSIMVATPAAQLAVPLVLKASAHRDGPTNASAARLLTQASISRSLVG